MPHPLQTPDQSSPHSNQFHMSKGLAQFLGQRGISFAFTSYDNGALFLIGQCDGRVSINWRYFNRCMGLAWDKGRLFMATQAHIHRLENIIPKGETSNNFDAVFISRLQHFTGDLDIHEIAVDGNGEIIFACTKYSCLATISQTHSFKPIWKPEFITKLAPEDRCHLNGFSMRDGRPSHVSIIGKSDVLEGWRGHRNEGGMILDIEKPNHPITGLSMSHSPRWYKNTFYYLDSGRGIIFIGDDESRYIFCPGFLRGLSFFDRYALVTVSLPRDGIFKGLQLQKEIEKRGGEAWCGVLIIDIDKGDIVEWFRIVGPTKELFDCVWLEGIKCPNAIAPNDPSVIGRISIEQEHGA